MYTHISLSSRDTFILIKKCKRLNSLLKGSTAVNGGILDLIFSEYKYIPEES